jgi:hypothetical protein
MLRPATIQKLRELSAPNLLNPGVECIIWKGKVIPAKPILRMVTDGDGTRYKAPGLLPVSWTAG